MHPLQSLHPLPRVMGAVAITAEGQASAALQVRRVQQIAQGQRPHAVGTQKSVVSLARFVAWSWDGFQRKSWGLLARFGARMRGCECAALYTNLMAFKRALHGQFPMRINDL